MSWQMWFAGVLFLVAVIAGAMTVMSGKSPRGRSKSVAVVSGVLGLLVFLSGMFTIVPTRQVGIVTQFGRPTGDTLDNGLHFKPPWANTTVMDAAIQYSQYTGDGAIRIRLGNNSNALADTSIRWRIRQDAASQLFVDYKTFDNVRVNLIERNLQVAENGVFQGFDPLASQWANGVPLQNFANQAADDLRRIVGNQVEILDVSISRLDYDENTESKINQLNAERANTATAEQAVKTAEQNRKANEILASQPPPNLSVSIANCLNKSVEKGLNPAGCWPIGGDVVPTLAVPNPRP